MEKIMISDITLRECETEYTSKLSFKEKQETAKHLDKLGIDVIETGYVTKTPADSVYIRMLAGAADSSIISVPVQANRGNIDAAWAALSKAPKPRLNLIIPTSTIGMEYSLQMKPEAVLELIGEMTAYAKSLCNDIEFTADDAVRSEPAFLSQAITAAVNAGAGTVTVCDAGGELLPDEAGAFVASVLEKTPALKNAVPAVHLKKSLGLAKACALKAIEAGARLVKTACSNESNTLALEPFLDIINIRGEALGICGNFNAAAYHRICSRISKITGVNDSLARKTDPDDVAAGKDKGTAALPSDVDITGLRKYIQTIGYDISDDDLERIFAGYKDIAKSKSVVADDVEALIAETAGQAPPTYKLRNFVINSGSSIAATAYVEFEKDGETKIALSAGDGPIDAAFKAAESIFGKSFELEDFRINAVTSGREATGDALVKLRSGGKLYSGRGVSTDIVGASIRAYLSAVNKILSDIG